MSEINATKIEETKTKINVNDPAPFGGNMKCNLISSMEMAEIVSSLFGSVFRDYAGCKIRINDGRGLPAVVNTIAPGALYVDLYFKENRDGNEGKKIATLSIPGKKDNKENSSLGERYTRVMGTIPGRIYHVSKETYECLEEFMFNGPRTQWNNHTQEITTQMNPYSKDEVLVTISGLDLNKVIAKIYGTKTKEGRFEYMATPSTVIPNKTEEFIMTVTQLDLETVTDLQKTLGIYTSNAPTFHQYNRG